MRKDPHPPMKISFDFDGTLDHPKMQRLAKRFMYQGCEVFITTARNDDKMLAKGWNRDIYEVASRLGISKKNIRFTGGKRKLDLIMDFDLHFDNEYGEVVDANRYSRTCQGVLFTENMIKKSL